MTESQLLRIHLNQVIRYAKYGQAGTYQAGARKHAARMIRQIDTSIEPLADRIAWALNVQAKLTGTTR